MFSPHIIKMIKLRKIRWAGHVARMGEMRNAYKLSVWKAKGKKLLGRPRRRRDDNIKMHLREIGLEGVDWINLARDRDWRRTVVNTVVFHKRRGNS
jgi:hypothetical protein